MISNEYSLVIKESILSRDELTDPVKVDSAVLADVSLMAFDWNRFTVRKGGFWEGSFILSTDPPEGVLPTSRDLILELFYEKLGAHVQELGIAEDNDPSWEGYIHEMTLAASNTVRIRTYDDLANSLLVVNNGGIVGTLQDNDSILRFGEVQKIVDAKRIANVGSNILNYLQAYLGNHAWGKPQFLTTIEPTEELTLEITVRGYIQTAAFKYLITTYTNANWNTVLNTVFGACDYLELLRTERNGTLITAEYEDNLLAIILELLGMGTPPKPFWKGICSVKRKVTVEPVFTAVPDYYIGSNGQWTDSPGNDIKIAARQVLPGVVEDTFFPFKSLETANTFGFTNTFYASRVGVDAEGKLQFSTENAYAEIEHVRLVYSAKRSTMRIETL